MSSRVRDPLYRDFIKALWAREEFQSVRGIVLSPEQQKTRERLALEVIAEVEAEESQNS